ncbi:ATP-binding protein [Desulfosporosinus sp. Sb-LF]|uniref:GAF domain-containing sensor histidine kinase n=1 Tax=Desulfosporosinus sp. Sb-LF TaxID=2560027 RepID=UPI001FB0E245|nr:ATP-binding protein [Desulfosporosinus sp. Sb-LF]
MDILNIIKRKEIEDELSRTNSLLKLFVQKTNRKAYLDEVLILLQEWIDCRCTGIRVLNDEGYVPYESFAGFSQEFMGSENWLSVNHHQCACMRVILEKPESQDAICMTNVGSFCCNNTIEFICEMSTEEQSRFRGKCIELGYKSVAIIPIRYQERVLGVIHLADEKEGKLPSEFIEFIEKVAPLIGEAMYRFNLEDELRYKNDNLERLVEERTKELKLANEQLNHDIVEQKLASEKLIRAQEEKVSILESMTDCFFAMDRDMRFTYINHAGEIAFGKSQNELLSQKITEVIKVNDTALQHYHEVMSEKKSATFEIISEALGGKWLEISAYSAENGLTCYFRDITSRKIAEGEIARFDRLNLVGQLAAGIAHEIRNPMTTVRGYLQLLGVKPEYATQRSTFELMISEVDRANAIITEFLSLAQTKPSEMKSRNLNDIISHLYPLLEADTFTQNKQIKFIAGEIPDLALNAKEISQLILNLTRNGLEAMAEGGTLSIESYVEDCKVVLEIADEGCGIPKENFKKLGTPFFTTKDTGTGLGFASCYKIAESHNAKICIDSSPKGTTISILFPIPKME